MAFEDLRRLETEGAEVTLPRDEMERLVRELRSRQLELETQNEALRLACRDADASRRRYAELFAQAPVGYLELGPHGVIEANEAAAKLLDVSPEEVVGMHVEDFLDPGSTGAFAAHQRAVFETMERVIGEIALSARSGLRRELRVETICTSAIRQQSRMVLVDVTQQRTLERELGALRAEIVGPVTRALAHDLRHVLLSIVGSADAAIHEMPREHAARAPVEDLQKVALRAGSMIADLLERGGGRPSKAQLPDLDVAVRQADAMLRRLVPPGTDLTYSLNAPVSVALTPHELDQILLNLVLNASDALQGGGRISIETRTLPVATPDASEHVVLSVHDTGSGMDDRTSLRAFEASFTTKRDQGGHGLGLANVRSIVQRRGGEVSLTSRLGHGTCVRVLVRRSAATTSSRPPAELDRRSSVLVVAERDFVRVAAGRSLEREGYRATSVTSAARALALLSEDPAAFAVLVTEASLSEGSGAELIERARALAPGLRCLVISNDATAPGPLPPRVDVIRAPFRPTDLVESVQRALVPSPLVLLVEDDPILRASHEQLLTGEGFRVLVARSGREALEVGNACADALSVVMSDFSLPDMDGGTLLEALRRGRPRLPILFVTRRSPSDPALALALAEPGVEVVTKPIEIATLARALRASVTPPS